MAKVAANPKKFIISCRVDDFEMGILRKRAQQAGVSITKLLRSSLELSEIESRRQDSASSRRACG